MSRLNELRKNLEGYQIAETTAAALEEISALRLQAIRKGFERNRTFYAGIRDLYGTVRQFGAHSTATKKKKRKLLLVALTSNKRFYGRLMRSVTQALASSLNQMSHADAIVIGRAGWQYVEEMRLSRSAKQVFFRDDNPTKEEIVSLFKIFADYESVLVLYPKFINPFRQDVGVEDIMQSPESAIPAELATKETKHSPFEEKESYIFEPEVPRILAFFDEQVIRVLFQGVLLEAELARTAARLVHLEESQERAHTLVKKEAQRVRREAASISESSLLETFAGYTTWRSV